MFASPISPGIVCPAGSFLRLIWAVSNTPPPPPPLPVGLDSPRAFSGPELSPTNACVLNFSGNSQSFQELPATNFDVPDYSANNFSGPGFSGNNVCAPNFSANSFSGLGFPATNLSFPELSATNFTPNHWSIPELSATNFTADHWSIPELSATNFSANNSSFPVLSATNFDAPDYSANNFSGSGFSAINFWAPNYSAKSFSGSEFLADNTLEALIHVSPSLRISPKEAIGVQIENNCSESVEVLPSEEVMPVDSSAQKPIGANKGKRTGRTKIEIALEDMLKYKTVKEAALNLKVSESTVDRRIKDHTGGSWSIAKRREFARKPVSKKGRMQDKNPVLVKVAYEGTKASFEMPWTSELGELHSLVESSLKLEAGTYDIQYFDGAEDISFACDANLHCCFANAPRSPRTNSILLNLTARH